MFFLMILLKFTVKLIGKLQDGTLFVKKGYDEEPPLEFKVDDGMQFSLDEDEALPKTTFVDISFGFSFVEQIIDGLDRAVKTMKKGEVV